MIDSLNFGSSAMVVAVALYLIERVAGLTSPVAVSLAMLGLNLVVAVLVFGLLDSGVFIRGSGQQQRVPQRRAERAETVG